MVMLLDYHISLLYLYKKIYSNHNRPPCTLSLGAKKVLSSFEQDYSDNFDRTFLAFGAAPNQVDN